MTVGRTPIPRVPPPIIRNRTDRDLALQRQLYVDEAQREIDRLRGGQP